MNFFNLIYNAVSSVLPGRLPGTSGWRTSFLFSDGFELTSGKNGYMCVLFNLFIYLYHVYRNSVRTRIFSWLCLPIKASN